MRGGSPRASSRQWLLPALYERLSTGGGEFLAELRPAYPMFVRFGGIDYDDDADAIAKLDDFVHRAQRILGHLRGQRPQHDARRQGRVPGVGGRRAAGTRGRRRARGFRARSSCESSSRRRPSPTSRSESPMAGCAAARTATAGGRRSPASAMRSIYPRDSWRRRRRGRSTSRSPYGTPPATCSTGSSFRRCP